MRLFRNHYQNPRYRIFFYHDWDVRYEMNGDKPWIILEELGGGKLYLANSLEAKIAEYRNRNKKSLLDDHIVRNSY